MTNDQEIQIKNHISFLLENPEQTINIPMISISDFEKIISRDFGFEMDELNGDEINGWQVDFWYNFKKDNIKLILEGSLYYGRYKIYIDNE